MKAEAFVLVNKRGAVVVNGIGEIVSTLDPVAHDGLLRAFDECDSGSPGPHRWAHLTEQTSPPCPRCDDTGDVHSVDGEWRGRCACPAGSPIKAVQGSALEQTLFDALCLWHETGGVRAEPEALAQLARLLTTAVVDDASIPFAADSGAQAQQQGQQWISVDERLPLENDGSVAVLFDDGEPGVAWATYWHGASNAFARWSFPLDDMADGREVTHWCALPQAPLRAPAFKPVPLDQDFDEPTVGEAKA